MANTTNSINPPNNASAANAATAGNKANAGQQQSVAKDPSLQEEQLLEEMLYRLDQAHLQLRRLRSALPRMLAPLSTKHPSPQEAFEAFTQSVERTNKEVTSFQSTFLAVQSEGIFGKAYASRKETPNGIKQWRASEHPDWADPSRKRRRVS